jgi:hypothetical protein
LQCEKRFLVFEVLACRQVGSGLAEDWLCWETVSWAVAMVCQAGLFGCENGVERKLPEQTWEAQIRANKLELFSSKYYAACAVGGMISSGSVHFLITPFDMLKVNMQVSRLGYIFLVATLMSLHKKRRQNEVYDGSKLM